MLRAPGHLDEGNQMTTNSLPEVLGNATRLGNFASGSPEWLELRSGTNIGGSDVGAALGLSAWTSPFTLWAKKSGRISDHVEPNEAMFWGTTLEPVIIDVFEQRHPDLKIFRDAGTYANNVRPWQIANPDAVYQDAQGEWGIIEVKTARFPDGWDAKNGVMPPHYRAQVLWYLQTFGFKQAKVVALIGGSNFQVIDIQADDFEMDANLAGVERWREYLLSDAQPDYDGCANTYETVRLMHPDITDDEVELADLGLQYDMALTHYEAAETNLNLQRSAVLDKMGSAKKGLLDGEVIVTRQARGTGAPYLVNKKRG